MLNDGFHMFDWDTLDVSHLAAAYMTYEIFHILQG